LIDSTEAPPQASRPEGKRLMKRTGDGGVGRKGLALAGGQEVGRGGEDDYEEEGRQHELGAEYGRGVAVKW